MALATIPDLWNNKRTTKGATPWKKLLRIQKSEHKMTSQPFPAATVDLIYMVAYTRDRWIFILFFISFLGLEMRMIIIRFLLPSPIKTKEKEKRDEIS